MKYLAFLRAVNVGGHNKIKMDDLKNLFESIGYKNIATFIQSGNVYFETGENNIKYITQKIEKKLVEFMKKDIKVFVRKFSELEKYSQDNPFGKIKIDDKIKLYIFFLYKEPDIKIKLPLISPEKEVNIFKKINLELFMKVVKIPGKASSPNNLIEKTFGVPATARNWNVINKIVEKVNSGNK